MLLHDQIVTIERASGPSPALDASVASVMSWPTGPELTESLEEAMRRIPDGWRIRNLSDASATTRTRAILEKIAPRTFDQTLGVVVGYGANRAMAMLAAVLRAIAHDQGSPMPPSQEFSLDEGHRPCVNDPPKRPKLHITA